MRQHMQITSSPSEGGWTLLGATADSDDSDFELSTGERDHFLQFDESEDESDDIDEFSDGESDFGGFDDDDSDAGLTKKSQTLLLIGYACGLVAPLLKSVSAGCAQALNGTVPTLQLSLMRYAAQILFVIPLICMRKANLVPSRKDMLWLLIAAVLNNTNNATYYGACVYLPVGVAGGTMASLSIVWATLVTLIVSGKVKMHTAVAVIFCIAGIVLLVQPDFLFRDLLPPANLTTYSVCGEDIRLQDTNEALSSNDTAVNGTAPEVNSTAPEVGAAHVKLGYEVTAFVLLFISSIAGVTVTVIMRYRLTDCNPFVGVLWFGACGVVISALVMPISASPAFPKTTSCIVFMFTHSCSASIASIFSMVGMMLLPPLAFYLLGALEMLMLALAQYTVLKHLKPGHRNVVEIVGICLVFISNLAGPGYSSFKQLNNVEPESENQKNKKNKKKKSKKKNKKEIRRWWQ